MIVSLALAAIAAASRPAYGSVETLVPEVLGMRPARPLEHAAVPIRSAAFRTTSLPETTFVGFSPGHEGPANYWSLHSAQGPGKAVRWDWETAPHGDSLQGWWPLRNVYTRTGGQTRTDRNRACWALDIGNNANYVINQGPGHKRTFGVVGVWHRDPGNTAPAPGGVGTPSWGPLAGNYSAWMGLRRHGDVSVSDAITGNAFNEDVLAFNGVDATSASGNDKGFPGYGSQMDQMLYRDVLVPSSTDLTISFSYRTNMSTGIITTASTRTGWFDKDPLPATSGSSNPQPGNFISSSDAGDAGAPRDSFMVYVGAPVKDDSCRYSDGVIRRVYDPQRRWFAEVVRANEGLHRELLTLGAAQLASMRAASGGRLRIVFRVKTNRGFDDEGSSYSSGGAGAAIVDAISYRLGALPMVAIGDFESASAIDNDPAVDPLDAWKSTGKPPAVFHHVEPLAGLLYSDICGQPGDPSRVWDLNGRVIVMGDHDNGEAAAGLIDGTAERNPMEGMISPAITLAAGGAPNAIGLNAAQAEATDDYYVDYDIYGEIFDVFASGNVYRLGVQCYPALDKNGQPGWGQMRFPSFVLFDPDPRCRRELLPLRRYDLIRTSNPTGIPDSIRIYLGRLHIECGSFGCYSGGTAGAYWDNVTLDIVDGEPVPATTEAWNWINDTFPASPDSTLLASSAAFDTTAALIKTGLNIAPIPQSSANRFDVPGDTVVVTAAGAGVRMDLAFRILPGPGNYEPRGRPDLGDLRALPNSAATIARSDPHQFWSSFLADNGAYGTPGGHPIATSGPLAGSRAWDANVWNSARCDTAEINLFADQGRGVLGGPPNTARWMATYHEADPRGGAARLGIARNRCFVATATGPVSDVTCGPVPAYLISGTPANGYDGNPQTVEGTKIIPDGLLTPGSHVEYFFRREDATWHGGLMPDTNRVFPQIGEGSKDGHRWQEFSVLPDAWKDPAYFHPVLRRFGRGRACMLVTDWDDGLGNERVWSGVADTIGGTDPEKFGAHNGWHARGDQDPNDPAAFVSRHGGHPGTVWDLYQVRASDSPRNQAGSLGSRLAYHDPANPLDAKSSRQGPTVQMLSAFYRMLFIMTGSVNGEILGPSSAHSQDDASLIMRWLDRGSSASPTRGIWGMGDGFAESLYNGFNPQNQLMQDYLGVDVYHWNYMMESGNLEFTPDLLPSSEITHLPPGSSAVLGVRSRCNWANDILDTAYGGPARPFARESSRYEDTGYPRLSGIVKLHDPSSHWIALTDGWNLDNLTSRNDHDATGRLGYMRQVLTNVFPGFCALGEWLVDVPAELGPPMLRSVLSIRNNPVRSGNAVVRFGLVRLGTAEVKIYDLSGRLVRTLADRAFEAGPHELAWDGKDGGGRSVSRGVYFARLRAGGAGFEDSRRVILLR